jgi:filamentous hemagglutinin family protein
MSSARHRDSFKPKLIALSVAACFSLSATQASANPTGGTVASGSASFASSGNTLTITNSANAIINWQNFSIGVNEITRFLQGSGSSAVLNRVVGANGVIPQSVIDGILSSNGRVFLLNSSGIVIGANARIDVAGFVASSLNLSDQDFRAGRMRFTETPGAGKVSNAGVIDTTSGGPGGRVFLVGPDVQNSGIIRSPQGEIILAAGKSVELVSENSPFVTVNITADSEQALNVGQLLADSGRIGMFGALVRQGGVAQANSAVVGANGEIRLVATKDLTLDAGSLTTANGPSGGNVTLQAQGGTNLIYGAVEAKGSSGQGGTIEALGVRVGVLGNGIIDASGDGGGGTVLVGGDQHGANPNIQNAQQTLIGPDGVIRADAGTTGDGGRVIVWSDAETRVFGSVSARGGSQSGNGGFVETSSAGDVDLTGVRVDTRAANGRWGTWLIDPAYVIFEPDTYTGGYAFTSPLTFGIGGSTTAHITRSTVENAFGTNGTVQVQATNDIDFRTDLTFNFATPNNIGFEARAQGNIDLAYAGSGAHTITTNGHNVTLSANDLGPLAGTPTLAATGTGSIIGGGNIVTNSGGVIGGNITLSGYGVNVGNLQTAGGFDGRVQQQRGNVTITAIYGGVQTGNITTRGVDGVDFNATGPVLPTAGGAGGAVTISTSQSPVTTGNIDASGGRGGNGGAVGATAYAAGAGGSGGPVALTGYGISTGAINSMGGAGGAGGSGGSFVVYGTTADLGHGGAGGAGGVVSLSGTTANIGNINVSGGAGGAGGSNTSLVLYGTLVVSTVTANATVGFGGTGGVGGTIGVNTTGDATTGVLTNSGGAGGAAGSGGSAQAVATSTSIPISSQANATLGTGGTGGAGSSILVISSTGNVSVAGIVAGGGIGGAGGSGGNAYAGATASGGTTSAQAQGGLGGAGGFASSVSIQSSGAYANISVGTVSAPGGTGGAAGSDSASASAISSAVYGASAVANIGTGGDAGSNSFVGFFGGAYGTVTLGTISTVGGAGGAANGAGSAQAYAAGASGSAIVNLGSGGFGNSGGSVSISGGTISAQSIDTSAGAGADGAGAASASATSSGGLVTTAVNFGSGHDAGFSGGSVGISATGSVTTGAINTSGASGGNGANASGASGYGGDGGFSSFSGGNVFISTTGATASISTGPITTRNGNGGNGGATTAAAGTGGFGGDGGEGGSVNLTARASVTVGGNIDATGSRGGDGGSSILGYGGAGGVGGNNAGVSIFIDPDVVSVGSISMQGGAGGAGGYGGIQGGAGGAGGSGASIVEIISLTYGSVTVGNIDVSGGSGGAGGASGGTNVYGGAGGVGGIAGNIIVEGGSIDMTSGGSVLAGGGAGGAAGSALTAGYGGAGGIGANGGTVDLFTQTSSGAYGTILSLAPLNVTVSGGTGGGGGATGGLSGAAGLSGLFALNGELVITQTSSNLDTNTVVQGTNQLILANTAPSADELEKRNKENKKKQEAAACK